MTRSRRSGMTMTEVLVALFVMALGAIAILTLFPLGMINMTLALKDDRTAQSASNADGYMRWYWKTFVVEGPTTFDPNLTGPANLFDTPPGGGFAPPGPDEPSYPIVLDPIGANVRSAPSLNWIGGSTQVYRRNLLTTTSLQQAIRTCTLLDGLTYTTNGVPATPFGSNIERDMRYNWFWVLQRPLNKNRNVATLAVVVFDKRGAYASPEAVHGGITFNPGLTSLQLPFNSGVQKGMWIMDATVSATTPTLRHANFYRVISATETPGNPALIDVELDTPIRRVDGGQGAYTGTVVVLAGVAEVFHRPNLVP